MWHLGPDDVTWSFRALEAELSQGKAELSRDMAELTWSFRAPEVELSQGEAELSRDRAEPTSGQAE